MATRSVAVFLKAETADFTRQLKSASKSLEEVAAKSDKTGKVAQTGMGRMVQSAQLQKEAWSTVSTGLLATGAAAGAMVGIAVKRFVDFDAAMSSVQAATHESAANMELLRSAAISAGADTQYSATEAAGAIEELAKAGISTADILNGGLAGALNLAAAGGMEVGQAAEIAATALTQFNLKGSDVGHVADLLAAGAGKAQGDVSDLGMALKQSGLVASQTGLSIEETTGALSAFASAGLIGSDAGTAFKSMLQRLTPQSKEAETLMKDLGISAYDASGNFVGLTAFAGNLHESLKDLTAEQRNSAMATIFGSDAVRAAAVLYEQGADGAAKWQEAVDDAGYAAETARARTDNLKGDVERLGGSLETVFIKAGSGANGVLRDLVQTAEGAVDAFGRLPEGLQQGALWMTALTAAGAGAAGIFMKLVPAIVETQSAMKSLNMSVPVLSTLAQSVDLVRTSLSQGRTSVGQFGEAFSMARSMGESSLTALSTASQASMGGIRSAASGVGSALLGAFGGPVGLAVTGLTVAIGLYGKSQAEAASFTRALTETLNEQTGALTNSSRAAVAKQLQDKGVLDDARDLGLSLDMVTQAAMGNAEAMDYVAKASGRVSNDALNNSLIPSLDSNYRKMSNVENVTKATADQVEASKSAWDNQSAAVDDSSDSQDDYTSATTTATSAIVDQQSELDKLIQTQNEAAGNVLSVRDAQRNFEEAVDAATAAVEENGATLDITTEAGRRNQDALDAIADSGWRSIASLSAVDATQEDLQASMQVTRDRFVAAAESMGMSTDEAEALADQLNLIPRNVRTTVSADTGGARQNIRMTAAELAALPSEKRIRVYLDQVGWTQPNIPSSIALRGHADGGILKAFAGGGENHIAQIARAGEMRLWAEPETGGEAYIPLASSKRNRSMDILRSVADTFGYGLQKYAGGGMNVPSSARVPSSFYSQPRVSVAAPQVSMPQVLQVVDADGVLVGRMRVEAAQQARVWVNS